ncbi:MAG: alpha/beta hydrolase [Bacteroidetes bacterium]|nr:MAG: alpha/beta hydrolase [Bacteroidota bacterium]
MKHQLPDGIDLYYELHGPETAEYTVLFLNGLSQSTLAWAAVAPAIAAGNRVVLLDLVCQGQSGIAEAYRNFDAHAADVHHLVQALGLDKVVLCGISYGSAVSQHILVNHPERFSGALLLSTFGHNTPIFEAIGNSWAAALRTGGYPLMFDVMLPTVLGENYFIKPFIPIETLKEARLQTGLNPESLMKLMMATDERKDYRHRLPEIKAPVHVIQGEMDILIPPKIAKEVADRIPGSQFTVLEGVGHTLNLEAIPQTIAAIKIFLEKLKR